MSKNATHSHTMLCMLYRGLILLMLALASLSIQPVPAHASGSPAYTGSEVLGSEGISRCSGEGVAARFVPCIKNLVMKSAHTFFTEVYPLFETVITTTMVLAVAFFGVMLITQWIPTPKASTETFTLIIKIACVVYFTTNLQWIFDSSIAFMDGLIDAVTRFSFSGFGGNPLRCPLSETLWERIDCVLDRIIGIQSNTGDEISKGILSFLWDNAFSGAMGLMIFLAGLFMLFNLVMGLFQAIAQYIVSLMILALIVMISLVFIPLLLFKQTAMEYFRRWVRQLISTIMQPVIVFAFLSVLLTALDVTMFSGKNSFYRTVAGDRSDEAEFRLSEYMEDNELYRTRQIGPYTQDNVPPPNQPPTAEQASRNGSNTPDAPRPRTNGSLTELLVGIEYRQIDWEKLANLRTGGPALGAGSREEAMKQAVGNSLLMSIITVFLLIQVMKQVPTLAQDLTSGVREGINTGGLAQNALSLGSSATGSVTQRLSSLVAGRTGGATR